MLKSRLITALILIPLVIGALFFLPLKGFYAVIAAVCVLAAWEWAQFAGLTTALQRCGLAALVAVAALIPPLFFPDHFLPQLASAGADFLLCLALAWWLIALVLVLGYPASARLWRHSCALRLLFGLFTLLPFLVAMLLLRQIDYAHNPYTGAWWLLYALVLVWAADSGAYAFGRRFGKHKLAPHVSPGKTWQGLAGGLLACALLAIVFSLCAPLNMTPGVFIVSSVAAALASVLGDLAESMFKREAGIKDSSHLIPGHGGVLDRIDSLTAAVPIFACFTLLIYKAL